MKTTNLIQNIFRILLGAFLAFAGFSHLTFNRAEFLAQVPQWVPLNPDLVVILSGIVEISLGLSLIFFLKQKRNIGMLAAIFFILVFPGNISQYINHVSAFGLNTDALRLARLFFQPVLVVWALWSTGVFIKSEK
jgi:uncharacterized membrane protein